VPYKYLLVSSSKRSVISINVGNTKESEVKKNGAQIRAPLN
jgi:hypothetical protein